MKKSASGDDTHHVAQTAFIRRLRKGLTLDETLRWNQRDVINTTIDFLNAKSGTTVTEHDSKNGDEAKPISIKKGATNAALIESSPGSGKTRMMGFIAKQAAHLNGADPTHKSTDAVKVLILTPRLDLNRQTLHEFDEELGIKDQDSALYDGNQTQTEKNRAKSAPVLIATYQSLPAMLQDGTISLNPKSPQYRGLVEMDEVHELVNFRCKPKGSLHEATIDSFINDHQTTLLFTGTDDGVSERHFKGKVPTIYSKRLVKAHNQGLTCDPIYPGLVDVSVKEAGFDTEKKKDRSKELVDYFGSHPKVIEAAVDAQLTAEHPGMGPLKRYKSLFFVNGVDAGGNGKDYFNKKAKELKLINPKTGDYLKAAHIHAKTPKAERKEIIKAYKNGEIVAIFNDSILTFGFDDREAAVIHNLKMHDRETGARALAQMEQIFTRGTRICDGFKKKPALDGKPYGIDKQALLLTYRPIDGHGQPLNVLTSTDLLAGLTLPVEASRPWQFRGESDDDIEKKRKSLSDDFEVHLHFDFDDQIAISEAMRKQYEQENQQYPSISGTGMLVFKRMSDKACRDEYAISKIYQLLEKEWRDREPRYDNKAQKFIPTKGDTQPFKIVSDKITYEIPFEQCGIYSSGTHSVFCVHESQIDKFQTAPEITEGMLGPVKFAKKVGIDYGNELLVAACKGIEEEWRKREPVFDYEEKTYVATKGGNGPLKVKVGEKQYEIPFEQCGSYKSGTHTVFCIHESQASKFAIAPDLIKGMLAVHHMAPRSKVSAGKLAPIYKKLEQEWKKRGPVFDYDKQHYVATKGDSLLTVETDEKTYQVPVSQCGLFKTGTQATFCVHESQSQKFRSAPEITTGMLAARNMGASAEIRTDLATSIYQALEIEWKKRVPVYDYDLNQYQATKGNDGPLRVKVSEKTYEIPFTECGIFQSGTTCAFCVNESQSQKFETAPKIQPGMLVVMAMAKKLSTPNPGANLYPVYNSLEAEWKKREPIYDYDTQRYVATKNGHTPLKIAIADKSFQIPFESVGVFKSKPHTPFCINESQANTVQAMSMAVKDSRSEAGKWKSTTPESPIKPNSSHIRDRSGRSRSAKDE